MDTLFTTLKNLLPAGTLTFPIVAAPHTDAADIVEQAEDGWTAFPRSPSCTFADFEVREEHSQTLESLEFLVHHRFLSATYRVDAARATLFVRVYVVPWDLPGSKGVLRSRDDAVLRPGRRRLKALFLLIRQDRSLWDGDSASCSTPKQFWENIVDNRTLLDIYNDLPSPAPDSVLEDIPALRSTLYNYQRRTISTMVERESHTGSIDDPLYLPLCGMDGKTFYVLPATLEIVTERPRISSVSGGILCEELGTGKTIMILSLILATLDEMSAPPEVFYEERTIMTPLSLRHFQDACALSERAKLKKSKVLRDTGVPSLVELMLHQCRVVPNVLELREQQEHLEQQGLWQPLQENVPFYLCTDPPRDTGWGGARGANVNAPRVMYLTTATLVMVPDNLQLQWANEIMKHCHSDLLKVLVVRQKDELPDAPILATGYDLVLISHSRFSREAQKKAMGDLSSPKPCECKPLRDSRVPLCICSRRSTVSPLLQIRWKRFILDEGHIASTKRTDYALFTKLLSVERRWIVTGTPTTNLLGLNFGSGSDLQYPEEDEDEDGSEDGVRQRRWHQSERDDFRKLGTMFADFLMMMPFASDPKAFPLLVADPMFDPEGPWPGYTDVLTQVMASVMVRHRIEDVEQDVRLPFLQHETILLDMDPYAVKTYNLIQATIAVNAVDSERRDQDYLFHPRNAASLQELVANISHVMFWHVVDTDLQESLTNAERCLMTLSERNGSSEDFSLIEESILHLRFAMEDPTWVALQAHYHAFHRCDNVPFPVLHAWNMLQKASESPPGSAVEALMPPARLIQLRDFLSKHPLKPVAAIADMGHKFAEEERRWREFEALQNRLRKKNTLQERRQKDPNTAGPLKRAAAEKKLEEMRREYQAAAARLTAESTGEKVDAAVSRSEGHTQRTVASSLLKLSPVAQVRVRNSTSTKLDYILNEVLAHCVDEKFLIFSDSPATLSFISEALDLVRVKSLVFDGKLKREERQAIVTTFETSDLFRVLLMELKHGARGLNLVSASRVIFCEPVWKADVESQAIKRVHRIGQCRQVSVKTLAIRGTSEEVMVARSKALKENKQEFSKEITDDRTIRDFIEHPTFLPIPTERLVDLNVPLFEFAPPPNTAAGDVDNSPVEVLSAAPRTSEAEVRLKAVVPPRKSTVYVEIPAGPPRKKQKVVTFAD